MKIIIVFVVIGIAIADSSDVSGDTEVTTNEGNDGTVTVSSLERQPMRPVFPKSVEKVIMGTKSSTETNGTTPVNRSYKKPVFKIVQKAVKTKSKSYWKTATRRPSLMKNTKFTIGPLTTFNKNRSVSVHEQPDREIQRKYNINQFRKTMSSSKDDSSEEDSETSTVNEKRKDKIKHVKTLIRRFHKLGSKITKENNVENISKFNERVNLLNGVTTVKPTPDEFSSDENEDRQEFIFVTPKIIQEHIVKVEEDSDESGETTTMVLERELKLRQKRSNNVIEEENLGTTVSGFKFTGKVSSLSSSLVFRNINT